MAVTTPKLVFHIEPSANPTKMPVLLQVVSEDQSIVRGTILDQIALERSIDSNRFQEARLLAEEHLNLIQNDGGYKLTPQAEVILKKREAVQYDLLHYLFYTAWNQDQPEKHTQAWLYQTLCNHLWRLQELKLDFDNRQSLNQQFTNEGLTQFDGVPGFLPEKFSIGIKSLSGVLAWLRALQPVVIEDEQFHRRSACSAELFLLALSRSYALSEATVGMDLLLSPQRRDEICQLCLLDPLQFDRMLDWVIPIYPRFLAQGTRAGSYGRFVRLHRLVNVEDLG